MLSLVVDAVQWVIQAAMRSVLNSFFIFVLALVEFCVVFLFTNGLGVGAMLRVLF